MSDKTTKQASQWSGVEWSGVERSGEEWSGVEGSEYKSQSMCTVSEKEMLTVTQ